MTTRATALLALLCVLAAPSCATNPATGERQLSLISAEQEVQMGRQAAAEVQQTIGFVDDAALQSYVERIGRSLATSSERPTLPWQFHVVNDATPNAFALPGGFIYVTRGMMNLMTSEAQLAGVLGHEIGHVTARHSVNQISKQQLAQLGLGIGGVLFPEAQQFGGLLSTGLGLLFLKYSRDDEREADKLGFEYMRKADYNVSQMADVFAALERASEQEGGGGMPGWLATHPAPEERVATAKERASAIGAQPNARVGRDTYLRQIDGLVYGNDPREGFFRDGVFYHPTLRFQLQFPSGWAARNLTQAVVAMAPDNGAVLQLTLSDGSPAQALAQFFSSQGIRGLNRTSVEIRGLPAELAQFQANTSQGPVEGLVAFIGYANRTYQITGYSGAGSYARYGRAFEATIRSFGPVADPQILSVQPRRVDIVQLPQAMTLADFARRYDSAIPADQLAIINQVAGASSQIAGGTLVKRVTG